MNTFTNFEEKKVGFFVLQLLSKICVKKVILSPFGGGGTGIVLGSIELILHSVGCMRLTF